MALPIDFPVVDEAFSFQTQISSTAPYLYWTSMAGRTIGSNKTRRGRQYELDSVQTGEYDVTLDNRDSALTPLNSSSPFYPNVVPFRCYRKRLQWPVTQQLLLPDQATMGDASGLAVNTLAYTIQMYSEYDPSNAKIVTSGTAWQGSLVMTASVVANPSVGHAVLHAAGWTSEPNVTFSFQGQVRCMTAGVSPQVCARFIWVDVNGTVLSTSSGSTITLTGGSAPSWTQVTASATAPANCVGAVAGIYLLNSPTSAFVMQCDGYQVERAASPSTWVQPGTWYNLFEGWAERYPQDWAMDGTFPETSPVLVDHFGFLSQKILKPPFYSTVLSKSPSFFFPLDDPSGSIQFSDLTGTYKQLPSSNSQYGVGSLKAGSSLTSTSTGGTPLGASGPVVTFNNVDGGASTHASGTFLELDAIGIKGPPAGSAWTRMMAFRCPTAPSNTGTLWSANAATYWGSWTYPPAISVSIWAAGSGNDGKLSFYVSSGDGNLLNFTPNLVVSDGNWHLLFFSLDATGKNFSWAIDGGNWTVVSSISSQMPAKIATDTIGDVVFQGNNYTYQGLQADVAHVAQWPNQVSNTDTLDMYNAWKTAYSQDSSDIRYVRILNWAGYNGLAAVQPGSTRSMGPATDIAGNDALTCLQNVVVTENGLHYIKGDGTAYFESRASRVSSLTPTVTFGEKTSLGEVPYEDLGFDFDTTKIANDVKITQYSTNQIFSAFDLTSQQQYGTKTLQRTVNSNSASECTDASNHFVNRLKQPGWRLSKIRIHPSARPGLADGVDAWAACLSLEISSRVRVMRRQPGQPVIQYDGFVEQIQWTMAPRSAYVDLEISPATKYQYWLMAGMHTTLSAQGTSGTNVVTVNALPDAALNPFKANFSSGLQVWLEPGTSRAELLTVQSVQTTSPGYTTCQITFTANLAFTHAIGSVFCEEPSGPAPTSSFNPAYYDSASTLDQTAIWGY